MKFPRKTNGGSKLDRINNDTITKEFDVKSVTGEIQPYKNKLRSHAEMMIKTRLQKITLRFRLGRG